MTKRASGASAEQCVEQVMLRNGWEVKGRNVRICGVECDRIFWKVRRLQHTAVICAEVKTVDWSRTAVFYDWCARFRVSRQLQRQKRVLGLLPAWLHLQMTDVVVHHVLFCVLPSHSAVSCPGESAIKWIEI